MSTGWFVYILEKEGYTYVGVSPDPTRRLRQHNGEIKGGARYTTSKGPGWKQACVISGCAKIQALQLEWAIKHCPPRHAGGLQNRLHKLYQVLIRERWTSKSPLSSSVPLHITWKSMTPSFVFPDHITETFEHID